MAGGRSLGGRSGLGCTTVGCHFQVALRAPTPRGRGLVSPGRIAGGRDHQSLSSQQGCSARGPVLPPGVAARGGVAHFVPRGIWEVRHGMRTSEPPQGVVSLVGARFLRGGVPCSDARGGSLGGPSPGRARRPAAGVGGRAFAGRRRLPVGGDARPPCPCPRLDRLSLSFRHGCLR